jgi:hypothetical protein
MAYRVHVFARLLAARKRCHQIRTKEKFFEFTWNCGTSGTPCE